MRTVERLQRVAHLERNECLRTIKRLGRTLEKMVRLSSIGEVSVETKMHCINLLGDKLSAKEN